MLKKKTKNNNPKFGIFIIEIESSLRISTIRCGVEEVLRRKRGRSFTASRRIRRLLTGRRRRRVRTRLMMIFHARQFFIIIIIVKHWSLISFLLSEYVEVPLQGAHIVVEAERPESPADVVAVNRFPALPAALVRRFSGDEPYELRHAFLHCLLGFFGDFGVLRQPLLHDSPHVRYRQQQLLVLLRPGTAAGTRILGHFFPLEIHTIGHKYVEFSSVKLLQYYVYIYTL